MDGGESLLSPPLSYFAASVFAAALAFAASDIFFLVAAEITLFVEAPAAFTALDFLAAVDFFAGTALLAAVLAARTYFRFCGARG